MKYKNKKVIRLKIIKSSSETIWYYNKVGESFYFYNKPFIDDEGILSLNKYENPILKYAYLEDTNYNIIQRREKLKNICSLC